jgi:site-specific recombinase XerD
MKKIISPKSSEWTTSGLKAKLREIVLEHHPDVAALDFDQFQIREAWALKDDGRIKASCELKLRDGSYRSVTCVVPFTLPLETKTIYRDWTIIITPTWYGYGYRLLDESGVAAGESSEDASERVHAEIDARRDVDRLLGERVKASLDARVPATRMIEPAVEVLPVPAEPIAARISPIHPGTQSDKLVSRNKPPSLPLPVIISRADEKTRWRFIEFFTANIRNKNTRRAYYNGVRGFFDWIDERGITSLEQINPVIIAVYIEQHPGDKPTVKQHLAAIRMLFDWLVVGQVVPMNPASAVRGPTHVAKRGKTPVLTPEQARQLLDSIDTAELIGLRDRALIGVMVFSFARVNAVTEMKVEDYFQNGKRWWVRLHEKGGKRHEVPAHHSAEEYLDAYLEEADLWDEKKVPLFQSIRHGKMTGNKLSQPDVYRMIRRRALTAGIDVAVCCHTWRATGITAYLLNGGSLETAQAIAAHESPRTTKLYDRTGDEITLDEVERIRI